MASSDDSTMEASFMRSSSFFLLSEILRTILERPIILPSLLLIGDRVTDTLMMLPSLRILSVSKCFIR